MTITRGKIPTRVSFVVAFDLPQGASLASAKAYTLDALNSYGGGLRPPGSIDDEDDGDPFFGGPANITVTQNDRGPERKWPTKANSV